MGWGSSIDVRDVPIKTLPPTPVSPSPIVTAPRPPTFNLNNAKSHSDPYHQKYMCPAQGEPWDRRSITRQCPSLTSYCGGQRAAKICRFWCLICVIFTKCIIDFSSFFHTFWPPQASRESGSRVVNTYDSFLFEKYIVIKALDGGWGCTMESMNTKQISLFQTITVIVSAGRLASN